MELFKFKCFIWSESFIQLKSFDQEHMPLPFAVSFKKLLLLFLLINDVSFPISFIWQIKGFFYLD